MGKRYILIKQIEPEEYNGVPNIIGIFKTLDSAFEYATTYLMCPKSANIIEIVWEE